MCLPWEAARAAAASEAIGLTPVAAGAGARPATGEEWPVAWIG